MHSFDRIAPGMVALCVRCGSAIERRSHLDLHRTAAFSLAALVLYFPANIFPILRIELYGASSQNTVIDGAYRLFRDGDFVIAVIVFLASVVIPFLKLTGLFFLVISTRLRMQRAKKFRTALYKLIEGVGRWAMLDVFVVAVIVSLVKLQKLATIYPGIGLFAFGGVVVFTLLASASFDPQLIWEEEE